MERPAYEVDGPHIHEPTWPWTLAGWTASGILVLFFLISYIWARF